ncbi:hypothetical protein MKS88_005801 [Plasmodium brasilianum]|uniref:Uncharacterized protein n=1 Tax=Plasmodium brasilianum TaxID=5824 RepID=A0ACB9Y4J4_PLABR|nr:hypothetical protein MKS88_005801 [Plasmodium brasilianum]
MQSSKMQSSKMQSSKMESSKMQSSKMQSSKMQSSKMQSSKMQSSKSYVPSLLRFYNWMLLVSSIISFYIIFEGIFTYAKLDLIFVIIYSLLTWVSTAFCWIATQNIYDGVRMHNSLLDSLNPKANKKDDENNKKWGIKKKFFGKGKTTKDSNYTEV